MALDEVSAGLDRVAKGRLGADGAADVTRLSAGATQEIWRFQILRGSNRETLILRRAPGGVRVSDAAVGLETEAALLEAAARARVPVPPVRYVLQPEDGLGHGFLMGFVEGETLGGRIARSEAFAEVRPKLARQCGEIAARIHTLDPEAFPMLKRQGAAEMLAGYREAYKVSGLPRPVFDYAFRWLEDHCPPPPAKPRLVHGDFRNGNIIFDPRDGVRAVLDWEIAFVGDPMMDLSWICTGSWRFGVVDKPVGGFGQREDLWSGYEAAGGAPVNRDHALWWEAFGSLRWGVMCAGMTTTFREADPNVERAVIARRASETEVDLMRLLAS